MNCKEKIIDVVRNKGNIKKTDLVRELVKEYSMSTIEFYIRELVMEGKLKKTREGRIVRFEVVV